MSWPGPPRWRHSAATATDFATSPNPAALASRRVLGTIGSAPVKVMVPLLSQGSKPA
ncbi:MAG: hypothetical protein JWQ81_8372 [Amycolatopsis sp.]|nr:hypothetical protein [Amycolatopsis sp.]